MIRIFIVGGRQAQFWEHETVCVCRRVIAGEYIEDERWERADDYAQRFHKGDRSYPLIFLREDQFGEDGREGIDIYRVARVDHLPNDMPAFLKAAP